jgi:secreted trypsin-like serine protease
MMTKLSILASVPLVLLGLAGASAGAMAAPNTEMIVGGDEAKEGQFPWQIWMWSGEKGAEWGSACGGSLISPQWVLTAAHCVTDGEGRDLHVLPEVWVHDGSVDLEKTKRHQVETVIVHEGYDPETIVNDIALVKLKNPIPGAQWIGIADPAADQALVGPGTKLTVSGWGKTWDFSTIEYYQEQLSELEDKYNNLAEKYDALLKGQADETASLTPVEKVRSSISARSGGRVPEKGEIESPRMLQFVEIDAIDPQACRAAYENAGVQDITAAQICATGSQGGKDSCQGDSGGPLVVHADNALGYLQVGIVSWGMTQCGDPTLPGIYTRVSAYSDWINNTMKNH